MDIDGRSLGVIMINVDLNSVFAALSADLPKDYQLFMANRHGDFLVHPDARLTFGFDKGRRVLVQDEFPQTRGLIESSESKVLMEDKRRALCQRTHSGRLYAARCASSG